MNLVPHPTGDREMDARARERAAWLAVLYAEQSLAKSALGDTRKRRERSRRLARVRTLWVSALRNLDAVLQ